MDFTESELGLIHDLINITWQAGAVKAPQMGQSLEQLREKVIAKLKPQPKPEAVKKEKGDGPK